MTITKINENTLMLELLKEEIPSSTEKLVNHIIGIAVSAQKLNTDSCAFLLEGTETKKGAVFLLTVRTMPKRYKIKKKGDCAIYSFETLDNFTDCIKALYRSKLPVPESSTYIMNDLYYLMFHNSVISKSAHILLLEYGERIRHSRRFAGLLNEYGYILTNKNSVELIGESFS